MLSNSPGSVGFEMAPFKLPQEYIDILGGIHGEKFAEYKALMKAAFLAVRKHSENILLLTEMMCKDSKLPCFQNGDLTVAQLRDRFQLQLTEPQAEELVDKLIMSSCCNVFTRLYDTFQYYSQASIYIKYTIQGDTEQCIIGNSVNYLSLFFFFSYLIKKDLMYNIL
jgi:phosphatidylinositol 4-kinase